MGFRAVVVDRDAEGGTQAKVREITTDDLPDGEVPIAIDWRKLRPAGSGTSQSAFTRAFWA